LPRSLEKIGAQVGLLDQRDDAAQSSEVVRSGSANDSTTTTIVRFACRRTPGQASATITAENSVASRLCSPYRVVSAIASRNRRPWQHPQTTTESGQHPGLEHCCSNRPHRLLPEHCLAARVRTNPSVCSVLYGRWRPAPCSLRWRPTRPSVALELRAWLYSARQPTPGDSLVLAAAVGLLIAVFVLASAAPICLAAGGISRPRSTYRRSCRLNLPATRVVRNVTVRKNVPVDGCDDL